MRKLFRSTVLVATALTALGSISPAAADDLATLRSQMDAASAAITSFVVKMHLNTANPVDATTTFMRPMKVRMELTAGPYKMSTYIIDGMVYAGAPDGTWRKVSVGSAMGSAAGMDIMASMDKTQMTLLPDRREDGQTVGAFSMQFTLPSPAAAVLGSPAQTLACTYDKTSFRVESCTSEMVTMTFTDYNNPNNIVVLPPAASSAALMVMPAAMPSPAASPPTPAAPSPTTTP